MIMICDAIMGSGKSMAAITYMNEHPDRKYIYISPYLDEDDRIADECPELHFVKPYPTEEFGFSKVLMTHELIKQDRNISTTHQAFSLYTAEILETIREHGYTLIMDEGLDCMKDEAFKKADVDLLLDGGIIENVGDVYRITERGMNEEYTLLKEIMPMLKARELKGIEGMEKGKKVYFYCWLMPPDCLTVFEDVFILTYLFEGQSICYYLQVNGLEYVKIGVSREETANGYTYRFSDTTDYIPEYVGHISDMIDILEDKSINRIGLAENALSKSWYMKHNGKLKKLKNDTYNFFRNKVTGISAAERMYTTYKDFEDQIKGDGYAKSFVEMNKRSSNEFRGRTALAYLCNYYMNPFVKHYYNDNGATVNEDMYSLSTLIQWIWRSAIRDGQKIHLYLPSSRMKRLLLAWMDSLERGGVTH